MTFMKRRLIALFCLGLSLSGCAPQSPTTHDATLSPIRVVADNPLLTVYVVTIDGHDYVMSTYVGHGIAICPKTP